MLKLRAGSGVVRFSILTSIALASLALGACGAPQGGDPSAATQSSGSTSTAPTISGTPSTSVVAGQSYAFSPSTTNPGGMTLTFSIINQPSWATFSAGTGQLSGTPTSANVGSYSNIVISVNDGTSSVALPAFTITVTAPSITPSTPPTIAGSPATSVVSGQHYSFTPTTTDPSAKTLTFAIPNRPAWVTFSPSTGPRSGTPAATTDGRRADIMISVNDGTPSAGLAACATAVTAPAPTAAPPTIAGSPATSVVAGKSYSFTPSTTDPSGKTLTFSVSNQPSWAAFSTATGQLSGTPASANVGSYSNIVDRKSVV